MAIRKTSILGGVVVVFFAAQALVAEAASPDLGVVNTSYSCDGGDCAPPHGWFDDCKLFGNDGASCVGILPSDHCFDGWMSPLSNPFFFEDPRSLTELRGIYFDNDLPEALGGNEVTVWSGQVRARVSENLSFIAPRLGTIEVDPTGPGAPDGWLSTPVGVKYNFVRDLAWKMLLTGGLTYYIPGNSTAFADAADGDVHVFLSGGTEVFENCHWISGTGMRVPVDRDFGTSMWYWSNQWDYELPGNVHPIVGINWFRYIDDASGGFPANVGTLDLLNLPSNDIVGHDIVTCAVGGRWTPTNHIEIGGGIEFPLSEREDILHRRVYGDVTFRY